MKTFKNYLDETNGRPKTDIERIMTHFDLTKEDIEKMSQGDIEKLIAQLPPRGKGKNEV